MQKYTRENVHKGKMPQTNEDTWGKGRRGKRVGATWHKVSKVTIANGYKGKGHKKRATRARWQKGKWTQREGSQTKGDTRTMGK